ncbi:hypothetical protein [Romboutsia timonensis]|uniref:hypothetical protein n=1 Tax=Romboutsia timonensis TaxID=1776391 RepID=UPI0023F7B2F4|nr:hypothetical protein [Romboutsia timonensis]
MKSVTLENVDLIADLFEETWTEEGAIVIYPYEDNLIQSLSQEDLKDDNLINSIYANEDVAVFDTACFEEPEGFQNLLRDLFKQYMFDTNNEIIENGVSLELVEKHNRYKDIYDILGGEECLA